MSRLAAPDESTRALADANCHSDLQTKVGTIQKINQPFTWRWLPIRISDAGPIGTGVAHFYSCRAKERQKMGKEDIRKVVWGSCGSCGLRLLFWSKDEELSECVKC